MGKTWARIADSRCVEFTDADPAGRFHPDVVWIEVPAALAAWVDTRYAVGEGDIAPPSLNYLKTQATALVAARRFAAETGGITMPDGTRLRTDRESQSMIGNAVALAALEPDATVSFKAANGWVTLSGAEMQAIGRTVGAHVRASFARERAIGALIDAATTPDEVVAVFDAEIDQGWPS